MKPPLRKKRPGTFVFMAHDFYRHPKVLALIAAGHHRAVLAHVLAITWCGDNKTDGWVPEWALPTCQARRSEAAHLVAVGLWEQDTGGWWIHGWLDWQDTNENRQARTTQMAGLANIRWHGHPDGAPPTVTDLDARRNA